MVAVLIAFPLLMLGTLVYVGLSAHEETPVGTAGAGQTGCVACASRGKSSTAHLESKKNDRELIAA